MHWQYFDYLHTVVSTSASATFVCAQIHFECDIIQGNISIKINANDVKKKKLFKDNKR